MKLFNTIAIALALCIDVYSQDAGGGDGSTGVLITKSEVDKSTQSKILRMLSPETVVNIVESFHRSQSVNSMIDDQYQRALKRGKVNKSGKAGNQCKARLEETDAKLDICTEELADCQADANEPKWLIVQLADMCTLFKDEKGELYIESSTFYENTEWFTDKPFQLETTQPTEDWFNAFDEIFELEGDENENDIKPNAPLTFVDDESSMEVVVSVFAQAYVKKGLFESDMPIMDTRLSSLGTRKTFCHLRNFWAEKIV